MEPNSNEHLINELLQNLQTMKRTSEISALHTLEKDIATLEQVVKVKWEQLGATKQLLCEATKVLHIMTQSIAAFDGYANNAENAWKQYFGIDQRGENVVFEMESIPVEKPTI